MYEVHCRRVPRKEREAFAMDASQKSQVDWNERHLTPSTPSPPLPSREEPSFTSPKIFDFNVD